MANPSPAAHPFAEGSWLINRDSPDSITHRAAETFINCIQNERRDGYGFVPLAGAGFSAPSGAPLVKEIKSYLERCICMALGAEAPHMEAWDPRTDQWPPFIDRNRNETGRLWSDVIFEEMGRRNKDPDLRASVPIFAEGFGAAAEWRTALLFLSRLDRDRRGTGYSRALPARLDAPQQEIIDSCFR